MKNKQNLSEEEVVREVLDDYAKRKEVRRPVEQSWLLNMNFLAGNQHSYISGSGEIEIEPRSNASESREVFNHIAPIIESRLAKLGRVRPSMGVRPSGTSESDLETAKLSKTILDSVSSSLDLGNIISKATVWSEVCGTSFYKIVWDARAGSVVGYKKGKRIFDKNGSEISSGVFAGNLPVGEQETSDLRAGNGEVKSSCENLNKNCEGVDTNGGGYQKIFDGDVSVDVCSPFEFFPESNAPLEIKDLPSIIHARAVNVDEVNELYGLDLVGSTLNTLSLDMAGVSGGFISGKSNVKRLVGGEADGQVLLIERWVKPCENYPAGRLTIVAGDRLVFDGDMPYDTYPFVKQVSNEQVGGFWGVSVVERCIPIQRAYNAIKNRKLECISRLCGGVLAVEDGSVDVDELEEDGLAPGKILVYRNGSSVPSFMNAGNVPPELSIEEERLENELIAISGVSELMRNSALPSSVVSGTAINLLIEQDDTRLTVSAENIRKACLEIAKRVLKLYKHYADGYKLAKVVDECGKLQLFYWTGCDISSDDVVLETSNELGESIASRKNMVLELLKYGLLNGEDGRMDSRTRAKVVEMLGFGNWENGTDEVSLQISRAKEENISKGDIMVLEVDDHDIHIAEHTKYILSRKDTRSESVQKLLQHIREHKMLKKASGLS